MSAKRFWVTCDKDGNLLLQYMDWIVKDSLFFHFILSFQFLFYYILLSYSCMKKPTISVSSDNYLLLIVSEQTVSSRIIVLKIRRVCHHWYSYRLSGVTDVIVSSSSTIPGLPQTSFKPWKRKTPLRYYDQNVVIMKLIHGALKLLDYSIPQIF